LRRLLVMLAAAVAGLYAVAVGDVPLLAPGGDTMRVKAAFESTSELRSGDPVRVDGIDVGRVEDVDLLPSRGAAVVSLEITDDDVRVRRDGRASLRWRTLLGGSLYVDLEPGTAPAPELGGDVIPVERTTYQVGYDDLNEPFDRPTSQSVRNIVRQFRRGLADPAATGRAIDALSPQLTTVARGARPLQGRRTGDLRRLVASAGDVADAVGRDRDALRRLVSEGAEVVRVTAEQGAQLGQTLELSPGSFDATFTTMRRVRATLDRLDPLAIRLRPGARALAPSLRATRPALDELRLMLSEARPLLRTLPGALDRLADASREGPPLFDGLDPTLDRLQRTLLPFLHQRDPNTRLKNYEAIGPTASASADFAGEFDNGGYVLHFPAPGDERSLATSPCQTHLSDPTAEEQVRCQSLEEVLGRILPPPADRSRK